MTRDDLVLVWEDLTRELYPDVEPFKLRVLACAFNRVEQFFKGYPLGSVGVTLEQWGDYLTLSQRAELTQLCKWLVVDGRLERHPTCMKSKSPFSWVSWDMETVR